MLGIRNKSVYQSRRVARQSGGASGGRGAGKAERSGKECASVFLSAGSQGSAERLTPSPVFVHSLFSMATAMATVGEDRDFDFPQREAAFFYGLFLRGHSITELRRDIEIPAEVVKKWNRERNMEPEQRVFLNRILEYRKSVLAIFDTLVGSEASYRMVQ
jgi:hypothetical protein